MHLKEYIKHSASAQRALVSQRFFKTGKGEYGEGDVFVGLTVPQCRDIAKKFTHLSLDEIKEHLVSAVHEERLIALLILVYKYNKEVKERKKIFDFYLDNIAYVNNWDLVDSSADKIVGRFLFDEKGDTDILSKLTQSSTLWERRVAIVSTFYFIKQKEFAPTFKMCELLMEDKQDLIHKACGWMLREVGKKDEKVLKVFLKRHYMNMPRTMLRYSIERFSQAERKKYLEGSI
jgi:3-methyladenine DNA glycosylase AlkD